MKKSEVASLSVVRGPPVSFVVVEPPPAEHPEIKTNNTMIDTADAAIFFINRSLLFRLLCAKCLPVAVILILHIYHISMKQSTKHARN